MTEQMRAKRSDAGLVRLSERDIQVFTWLSDMKAIYETDLRILLGRLSNHTPSDSAVRQVIARWQRGGYVKAQKLLVKQPRIVWLLPAGAAVVGEENWKETAAHTSIHQAEVGKVRLWLETRENPAGPVVEWESERRFRQWAAREFKDGGRSVHIPDAVVTFADGTKAALEVELSEKQRTRLITIVERLTTAYKLTIYATPEGPKGDAIRRQIRTAYDDVKKASKTLRTMQLALLEYPEFVTDSQVENVDYTEAQHKIFDRMVTNEFSYEEGAEQLRKLGVPDHQIRHVYDLRMYFLKAENQLKG